MSAAGLLEQRPTKKHGRDIYSLIASLGGSCSGEGTLFIIQCNRVARSKKRLASRQVAARDEGTEVWRGLDFVF